MVILLFIEESDSQIVSGIPEFVILSTNEPATIFYTLDGSEPDLSSEIFIDRITMPTDGLAITLKAIAVSGAMTSSTLEQTYFTDQGELDKSRLTGDEGINILPPDSTVVDNLSFNKDGELAQKSSIPFQDLDIRASTTSNIGEEISGNTTIDFINFPVGTTSKEETVVSSPNDNIHFDPMAAHIIIDGTTEENLENQVVRIINRPHGTMDLVSDFYKSRLDEYQLVSSNFVRHMINPSTGKITFYYRDSRENRWIKSTQKVEGRPLNLSTSGGPPSSFVFRWIEDRAQTKIY